MSKASESILSEITEEEDDDYESDEENGETLDTNEADTTPTINEIELTKKETYYYKIIDKYYKSLDSKRVSTMIDIIEGESTISLRLLDWFVTRYANKYKIRYFKVDDPKNPDEIKFDKSIDKGFNVHISYKAQLKSYKKKYFDPFRRRKKFKYFFNKEKNIYLCTTIGQLNFFRWAFNNYVIEYVDNKYKTISKAMGTSNKMDKTRKQKSAKQTISKKGSGTSTEEDTDDKVIEEIKVKKNGINIKAQKKETSDEIKIVLSFD